MKPTTIFGIILLLVIPLSFALDCNTIQNKQYCFDIQNSNISASDKDYLLGDILSDKKQYPDLDLISNWNSKITGMVLTFEAIPKNRASAYRVNALLILMANQ